jgi:hypothetical protein
MEGAGVAGDGAPSNNAIFSIKDDGTGEGGQQAATRRGQWPAEGAWTDAPKRTHPGTAGWDWPGPDAP